MALGQAPFDLPLVMLAAMAAAVWLFGEAGTVRRAALTGWCLGLGYFGLALHWIVSPFLVDVARHGWMAPFAVVLLSAGLALFWGLAFGLARWLGPSRWLLVLSWPAVELLRAYVFTGFPWAMPAQALVDGLAGQGLAWVGPYALNLALVAGAVALVAARWPVRVALALGLGVLVVLPPLAGPAPMTGTVVRLVQPNAAQHEKWDPALVPVFFERQLAYTAADDTGRRPDAVIWSETAIPWTLERAGGALEEIGRAADGVPVILGVQRIEGTRIYNALAVLGPGGAVAEVYDKHHLVPFGEYLPLGDLAARFGLHGMAAREGNGYTPGPGARILEIAGLGAVLPLICYEAVFAHDVNAAPARPALMVQVTNDAWFGKGAGPLQHLAQARMRAIEQGVPLARSANTGVSAMIDPWGRVTGQLALNEAGYLDAEVPQVRPRTLYARTGDLPLALILGLGLLAAAATQRFRNTD